MKRALILIALSALAYMCAAQSGWPDTTFRRHSIGVDVTAFLWRYVGHSDNSSASAPYWVSYRYRFNSKWNLRTAIGGDIQQETKPGFVNDIREESSEFNFRVGVERAQELAKRWQIFYGLDVRTAFTHYSNDRMPDAPPGYIKKTRIDGHSLGPAVLFGLRYKITPRFSILTETSVAMMFAKEKEETSQRLEGGIQTSPSYYGETTRLQTQFSPPLSVTATFAL